MNRLTFLTCFFILFTSGAHACPTCASSLDDYTPPFFSEEFYTAPHAKKASDTQSAVIIEGENNEERTFSTDSVE